jgi:hypothetical protein
MKKRIIAMVGIIALSIGLVTGGVFSLTPTVAIETGNSISQSQVDSNINNKDETIAYQNMIKVLRKNGYGDLSKAHLTNDYEYMDEFMSTMTDEDYDNMINIMEASGYGYMADMMNQIDRGQILEMHNAMGGAEACHGSDGERINNNMMNGY